MCLLYMIGNKKGFSELTILAMVLNFTAICLNILVEVRDNAKR